MTSVVEKSPTEFVAETYYGFKKIESLYKMRRVTKGIEVSLKEALKQNKCVAFSDISYEFNNSTQLYRYYMTGYTKDHVYE